MKCLTLLMFLIILIIQSSHSSYTGISTTKKCIVNRTLSDEELKAPYSYLNRCMQITSIQTDYSAPFKKPKIEWKQKYINTDLSDAMVDSQGYIWLTVNKPINQYYELADSNQSHWNKIIQLDEKGNICFRKYIYCLEMRLVTINDNSIVIYRKFEESNNMLPHKWDKINKRFADQYKINFIDLECYDFDGNLIWQTEPEPIGISYISSKRLHDDRILLSVGEIPGKYNIYSLHDGALIEELLFPDWDNHIFSWEPIEISTPGNEGWVGEKRNLIVRYDTNLNPIWEISNEYISPLTLPLVSPKGLLVYSDMFNMFVLDVNTGDPACKEYPSCDQIGLTNDGNLIMMDSQNENLKILDGENGRIVKELSNSNALLGLSTSMIVYQDNSLAIGIGNNRSVAFTSYDGTELWVLDISSIGIPQNAMVYSYLIPSPDSRIILVCEYEDYDFQNKRTILASLSPDE